MSKFEAYLPFLSRLVKVSTGEGRTTTYLSCRCMDCVYQQVAKTNNGNINFTLQKNSDGIKLVG